MLLHELSGKPTDVTLVFFEGKNNLGSLVNSETRLLDKLFNIWPFRSMKFCPSRFKTLPSTRYALKKWRKSAKSGLAKAVCLKYR